AAEFAVGDRLQADLFLLPDGAFDLAVLDRPQRAGVDLALRELRARLLERGRPQQAADVVGAERGRGAFHLISPQRLVLSSRASEARPGTHTPQFIDGTRRMGPRLRGDDSRRYFPHTSSRRNCHARESGHPVIARLTINPHHRGYWVPACAGTTAVATSPHLFETKLSCPRKRASSKHGKADIAPPGLLGPRFRGDDNGHQPHTSSANSTIIASFAHCSSSARILPSSVEAKPHCGERQSCSSS